MGLCEFEATVTAKGPAEKLTQRLAEQALIAGGNVVHLLGASSVASTFAFKEQGTVNGRERSIAPKSARAPARGTSRAAKTRAVIYESRVIAAVRLHLESQGWTVLHSRGPTEHGDDIVAVRRGAELRIEAKGEASEQPHTNRYGQVFTSNQVGKHVAVAFYRAAKMRAANVQAGMAFPDNAHHREMVAAIQGALDDLGISVYWVNADGVVKYGSAT